MEGWRQGQLGGEKNACPKKKQKNPLDSHRLLMEGDYTNNPVDECNGDFTSTSRPDTQGVKA